MKKLLIACAALLAVVSAYGQGRVAFANTSTTLVTTNNGAQGSISGLDNFYIGLYVGNAGSTSNQLVLAGVTTNSAGAGRFTGGNPFTVPTINAVNYGDGRALAYQLRAWSRAGNAFTDYETAFAKPGVLFGASDIGTVTPTFSPTGAAAIFGGAAGTLTTGFVLAPSAVPEPSSIALGLLGLGAIALFRRRK